MSPVTLPFFLRMRLISVVHSADFRRGRLPTPLEALFMQPDDNRRPITGGGNSKRGK
jgi:hypothetical protein